MGTTLKPRKASLDELTRILERYERKFGYSTIEFFRRYSEGKLGDGDEFMIWAGIFHLYLKSLPVHQPFKSNSSGR